MGDNGGKRANSVSARSIDMDGVPALYINRISFWRIIVTNRVNGDNKTSGVVNVRALIQNASAYRRTRIKHQRASARISFMAEHIAHSSTSTHSRAPLF